MIDGSPSSRSRNAGRIVALDLIRGAAVLGILAINIAGFAGPSIDAVTPNFPHKAAFADELAWVFGFLFFEGKMRALFAILFGASLSLFCEKADEAGRPGELLQFRRLAWLMLFGMLHYLLLWWGDILFVYGVCGIVALLFRPLPTGVLLTVGLAIVMADLLWSVPGYLPAVMAEEAVRLGVATSAEHNSVFVRLNFYRDTAAAETALYTSGYLHIFLTKLLEDPFWLFSMTQSTFTEVLPLMLLGMALQRHGFFKGSWPRRRLVGVATLTTGAGFAMTLLALGWAWPRDFPPTAMYALFSHGLNVPHLLMAIGYAAMLVLATPALMRAKPGKWLISAGRMAFSNYIGTSVLMTAIFYGWGLGLFGTTGAARQWLHVVLGWVLMLAGSTFWLRIYRQGPLEWLWRSLVAGKPLPNRRNCGR